MLRGASGVEQLSLEGCDGCAELFANLHVLQGTSLAVHMR